MSIEQIFGAAGCHGFVHATTLDGRFETGVGADEPVVPASVIKVLVAVEAEDRMARGLLDPTARVTLPARDRTPGPVGLSLLDDDVQTSLRDLVSLMLTISDNVATDALVDRVGLDALEALADRLGLGSTRMGCALRTLIDSIAHDAGFDDWRALSAWSGADPAEVAAVERLVREAAALQPDAPIRTTARDMTTLLRLIWLDRAAAAEACRRVREHMALQLTRNRLAAGFGRTASVAAKTGSLMGVWRNEVGVVTFPEGETFAVAVFTRADDAGLDERTVDAAIGAAAAYAVDGLRRWTTRT